jgi:hypothetical protein
LVYFVVKTFSRPNPFPTSAFRFGPVKVLWRLAFSL